MSEHQHPIGIDLGTTFSAIASLDKTGKPYCIPNQDGELITPTALLVDKDQIIVGREAVNASIFQPHDFADCFKRDMGSAVYRSGLNGVNVPPQVLNAFILQKLISDGERVLGPITKAVITVPAFFDENRRKATQQAGELAGLEVLDVINEPTAAALAFGYTRGFFQKDKDSEEHVKRVLIYDLGGGTFDVTVLEMKGDTCRALATDGDVRLGGKDFDQRLVEFLASHFIREHGTDPRSDPNDAAELWVSAERAKHALSQRNRTTVVVSGSGLRSRIDVTRKEFETITRDLLARTETTTAIVLRSTGLSWADIDSVLLVGGSSRMPAVKKMLTRLSGTAPDESLSPDQAVAEGAAIRAAMLSSRPQLQLDHFKLININSHSLGVKGFDQSTQRHQNAIMIPKNTPLPCRASQLFRTHADGQDSIQIVILEGESFQPSECIELGNCVVRDLPENLPAGSKVEVMFEYSIDARLSVAAKLKGFRNTAAVEIFRSSGKNLGQLSHWTKRLLASDEIVDTDDLGSILRKLDELYFYIGRRILSKALPSQLQRYQATCQKYFSQYRKLKSQLNALEKDKTEVSNHAQLISVSSSLAKARENYIKCESQTRFSCIVLGRESCQHGLELQELQEYAAQVEALKDLIE